MILCLSLIGLSRPGCQSRPEHTCDTRWLKGLWWHCTCPAPWRTSRRSETRRKGTHTFRKKCVGLTFQRDSHNIFCIVNSLYTRLPPLLQSSNSSIHGMCVCVCVCLQLERCVYVKCVSTGPRIFLFHVAYSIDTTVEGRQIVCKCHKVEEVIWPAHTVSTVSVFFMLYSTCLNYTCPGIFSSLLLSLSFRMRRLP